MAYKPTEKDLEVARQIIKDLTEKGFFEDALNGPDEMEQWINANWDYLFANKMFQISYGMNKVCIPCFGKLIDWVIKVPFRGCEAAAAVECDNFANAIDENVDAYFAAMYQIGSNIYLCEYADFEGGEAEAYLIDYFREKSMMGEDDVDWDLVDNATTSQVVEALYDGPQPALEYFLEKSSIDDLRIENWGRSIRDGRIVCRDFSSFQ